MALNSLKFVSKKTDVLNSWIKNIFSKIMTWNYFEILLYSIIPIFFIFLTLRISQDSFGRILIEFFSFLIWLYFFMVNLSQLYKHGIWEKILLIKIYNEFPIKYISLIQYCIGIFVFSKKKYFKTFPLILTDILAIIFIEYNLKKNKIAVIAAVIHIFYLCELNVILAFVSIQNLLDIIFYPWILIALLLILFADALDSVNVRDLITNISSGASAPAATAQEPANIFRGSMFFFPF